MKRTYIILRDPSRPQTVHRGAGREPAPEENPRQNTRSWPPVREPSEPKIEFVEAEMRHANELVRDAGPGATISPAIPVVPIRSTHAGESEGGDEGPGPTWGLRAIAADTCRFKGQSARVAVIDSGIREDHLAFPPGELRIEARDFTGQENTADQTGHGTHCAATILGRDVRGRRIGVAPGVRDLFVARIFAPGVATTSEMLYSAILWAMEKKANVISMSLSFDFAGLAAELHEQGGLPVEAAMAMALDDYQNNLRFFDSVMNMLSAREGFAGNQGTVIVAAAGNHSRRESKSDEPTFAVPVEAPGNAVRVISVGALRRTESGLGIAPFSNSRPTLVAPGFGVLSADIDPSGNDLLTFKNGTSMACPHVAGLAALWWDAVMLSGGPVRAQNVISKLQAGCQLGPISPGLPENDRGLGIPMAPA